MNHSPGVVLRAADAFENGFEAFRVADDVSDAGSLALAFTSVGGPVYLTAAAVMNAGFVWGAWRIVMRDEVMAEADRYKVEKKVFSFSLLYLFVLFGAILVEAGLHSFGYGAL